MLNVTCKLNDKKVHSKNIQFLIGIKEYVEMANNIINNNPFQRKRVSKSGSVYSLLKEDLLSGCIIPPIVLASTQNIDITKLSDDDINEGFLRNVLSEFSDLKILDGLQRTFSLIEVYQNNKEFFDAMDVEYQIRVEIYLSISDTGILYRMLTLNTGQTPMSLRHQLEILFSKYLETPIGDINIIRDIDDDSVKSIKDYKFSDLIEGYNSFVEKNELPIDRFDILQSVKTIKFISNDKDNSFDFPSFVSTFNKVASQFDNSFKDWEYPKEDDADNIIDDELKTNANPYGKVVYKIFNRSQTITGFGAAIGELIDNKSINKVQDVNTLCERLVFNCDDLLRLNKCLDDVREKSKKIGNGQRIFFKIFFKNLLDREGATFLNVSESLDKAKNRALAEV